MSNLSNKLSTIANAIRAKASTNNLMLVDDFAPNILNIPTGIEPTGTETITNNGTYNIYNKAEAVVNVPVGVFPAGSQTFNTNGTYNVYNIAEAVVNVAGIEPSGSQEFNTNGTYNVYNIAQAVVNVPQNIDMNNYTYLVNSVNQRDQLSANKDDICILYSTIGGSPSIGDTFEGGIIVDSITVPKFEDDWSNLQIRTVDGSGWGDCFMDTYQMSFNLDLWSESGSYRLEMSYQAEEVGDNFVYSFHYGRVEYDDEGEYVSTELNVGDNYELPSPIVFENGDGSHYEYLLQMFNSFVVDDFEAYSYNGDSWEFLDIGTNATSGLIYDGATAYTSNGHIMGSFGTLDTADQVPLLENILVAAANASSANLYQAYKGYAGPNEPITLKLINTSGCENFAECFDNSGITYLPKINTVNAKDYSFMFHNAKNITDISNIQYYNFENIDSARAMFDGSHAFCNVNNIVVNGANDIWTMFSTVGCDDSGYPTDSIVSNIQIYNASNCVALFSYKGFNKVFRDITLDNVSNTHSMFYSYGRQNGTSIIENLTIKNTANINGLFRCICSNTTLSNIDFGDTVSASNLFSEFYLSSKIPPYIDFVNTNIKDISNMFSGYTYTNDTVLLNIMQVGYNFSTIENFAYVLYPIQNKDTNFNTYLSSIDLSNARDISGLFSWAKYIPNIYAYNINTQKLKDCNNLFVSIRNTSWGTITLDLPNVTNANNLFSSAKIPNTNLIVNLPNLSSGYGMFRDSNFGNVDVTLSEASNISFLFGYCNAKTAKFNLGGGENIVHIMGYVGNNTTSLEVNINMANTINAYGAFSYINISNPSNIKINIGNEPYTSKVECASNLFTYSNIREINFLPDMPNLTEAGSFFAGCKYLTNINCNFNAPNVTNISRMFQNCQQLIISNMDMFENFGTVGIENAANAFCNTTLSDVNVLNKLNLAPNVNISGMFKETRVINLVKEDFINRLISTTNGWADLTFYGFKGTIYLPRVLNFSAVTNISSFIRNTSGYTNVVFNSGTLNIQAPNTTSGAYAFTNLPGLRVVENVYLPNATYVGRMFSGCQNIEEIGNITVFNSLYYFMNENPSGKLHTVGNITITVPEENVNQSTIDISYLFANQPSLVNVGSLTLPKYKLSHNMYVLSLCRNTNNLSSSSVDNIIGGLANCDVTDISGGVNLNHIGMDRYASIIPTLSNYNNFINAGWTV